LHDRFGDVGRLVGIERSRQAGRHIAEGAGAGAGVAHDHHGRVRSASSTRRYSGRPLPRTPCELELAHQLRGSRHTPGTPAPSPGSSPACAGSGCPGGGPSPGGVRNGRAARPAARVSRGACRVFIVHDRARYGSSGRRRPAPTRASSRKGWDAGRRCASARPRSSPASWRRVALDQLGHLGADHVGTQQLAGLGVEDVLTKPSGSPSAIALPLPMNGKRPTLTS
jgi:hypothetical protein